ncbi:hypothetical protein Cylst_3812 [Cylindrospermum stagnale PCC 7417]|uniref:Uncharacterized protein n=1 Tax=Cylindrospermum stagnale PCC 7417 TaxID=56107 RepID=K9WZY5_9NOST|nr:hypothetical protein Cylst_3812 [Cylindrospermum stagnale PCC 7417]
MLEKLMQAAFITFLLHLIAGLSVNTQIPKQGISPVSETSASVLSSAFRSFE